MFTIYECQTIVAAEGAGVGKDGVPAGLQGQAQPGEAVPEFDADWGLETLVNVGEHWITSLLQVSCFAITDIRVTCLRL